MILMTLKDRQSMTLHFNGSDSSTTKVKNEQQVNCDTKKGDQNCQNTNFIYEVNVINNLPRSARTLFVGFFFMISSW